MVKQLGFRKVIIMEMKHNKEILQELTEATLLSKDIKLPYNVPTDYFETLPSILVKNVSDDKTNSIENVGFAVYSVPNGYFKGLSNAILASVINKEVGEELDTIAPTFKTISKEVPYQTPEGYFENLQVVKPDSKSKVPTKVISISSFRYWLQIGVAASLVGVIALCATLFSNKGTKDPITYLSYKSVDIKGDLDKVSDAELVKYLNNDNVTSNPDLIILDDGVLPNVLEQKIQTVSDDDLKQYLRQAGVSKNLKKGI